jgi:flagellar biosynthesis protein
MEYFNRFSTKRNSPGKNTATALGYDPEKDSAPRVLAQGEGLLAKKIISLAIANNIPLREDPVLAAALATLEINDTIPPEMYRVVAEVLAYVYRIHLRQEEKGQKR